MASSLDLHRQTVLEDVAFDAWMCAAYGTEWRWEMPYREQRMHAKNWNFTRLYGRGR